MGSLVLRCQFALICFVLLINSRVASTPVCIVSRTHVEPESCSVLGTSIRKNDLTATIACLNRQYACHRGYSFIVPGAHSLLQPGVSSMHTHRDWDFTKEMDVAYILERVASEYPACRLVAWIDESILLATGAFGDHNFLAGPPMPRPPLHKHPSIVTFIASPSRLIVSEVDLFTSHVILIDPCSHMVAHTSPSANCWKCKISVYPYEERRKRI